MQSFPHALRVRDVMSKSPITIDKAETLRTAHRLMRDHGVRHLPVTGEGKLVGVVSLGDLHLIETLLDVDPESVPVEDAMSAPPYEVGPDTALAEVARHMAREHLGSAVVVEGDEVLGIFTTTDALGVLAKCLEPGQGDVV